MQEKPDIPDQVILSCLQTEYGLDCRSVEFLPLGADVNTAVYRAESASGQGYFVKLRRGDFTEITVTLPHFLKSSGIHAIIAPLETSSRRFWAELDSCRVIVYPFIPGRDGYEQALSQAQWREFGRTMKAIHTVALPPALSNAIPRETFPSEWRKQVLHFQLLVEEKTFAEPVAAKLAACMQANRQTIHQAVRRAEQLGRLLQTRSRKFVLCHSDIHPGNLHLSPEGAIHIVDWDQPILAPAERDVALIGGCPAWSNPAAANWFFEEYGRAGLDPLALAYYRYERVIWDLAAFCQQILLTDAGGQDREQGYCYFAGNFLPGHEMDLARAVDPFPDS